MTAAARHVSGRLVRSFLRTLRERVGGPTVDAILKTHPLPTGEPSGARRGASGEAVPSRMPGVVDWVAMSVWQPFLEEFERRFGDPATLRFVREITRSTMAVAVSKAWSGFLSGATHETLLASAPRFWSLSYDSGTLVVAARGPRRVLFAVDDWPDPPAIVGASVAEAVAVFLARMGQMPRAVDRIENGRAEVELTW
jgi:hypothetical protein